VVERLDAEKIVVIGGAGRVGLGMSIVLANAGFDTYGIDLDESRLSSIMSGTMPHIEEEGPESLKSALDSGLLTMTTAHDVLEDCGTIIVTIGTPVDEHLNPVIYPLEELFEQLSGVIKAGQMVILRSTVSPGTTDQIKSVMEKQTGLKVGEDIDLVFAPERTAEGRVITELRTLPQLIGAYDDRSFERAKLLFERFSTGATLRLTPTEAEIGKLISNMTRYVTFALANEYHLIGNTFGVNINKVIDAANYEYPRLNMPSPGPNVGGPCLYKDGWFLIERNPYPDLISTAFRINEGMPMDIVQSLRKREGIERVAILGATFKANSDDIRNSLSFKLAHQLHRSGYEYVLVEPNLDDYSQLADIEGCDAVVLMTPHKQFKNLSEITSAVGSDDCVYVDIWGFWDDMKYLSIGGIFEGKEIPSS
jgi:UDP-N-acetyl-D-mannosaminuronic acid dehydrogenase